MGVFSAAPPDFCGPTGCLEHLENFSATVNANLWEGDLEAYVSCDAGAQAYATWSLDVDVTADYTSNGTVFFTGVFQPIDNAVFTNVTGDGSIGGYPGDNSVTCGLGSTSGTAESVNSQMSMSNDIQLNFNSSEGGWYKTGGGTIDVSVVVQATVDAGIVQVGPGFDTSTARAGLTMPLGTYNQPDNFVGYENSSFNWWQQLT
jgi:hypothetical protein